MAHSYVSQEADYRSHMAGYDMQEADYNSQAAVC
jgi:hypothetical protein